MDEETKENVQQDQENQNLENNSNQENNQQLKENNEQNNNVQENQNVDKNNIIQKTQIDEILEKIDKFELESNDQKNLLKTVENTIPDDGLNKDINGEQNNSVLNNKSNNSSGNSFSSSSPSDNQSSQKLEVRVLEKNKLETDVIASLRDPLASVKVEKTERVYEPKIVKTVVEETPSMTISSVVVEEGSTAIFNVTLSKVMTTPYTVTFNTSTNGSAESTDIDSTIVVKDSNNNVITPNADGSYTVPPGETSLKVEVKTTDDNIYEGPETFELNGKTEYMSSNTKGTGTIKDDGTASDGDDVNDTGPTLDPSSSDDDTPSMTIGDVTVEEGSKAIFAITLDKVAEIPYKVTFNTSDNTAISGDYSSSFVVKDSNNNVITPNADGSYNVPPGETNLTVEVSTTDDNIYEGSETFKLNGKTEFMGSNTFGTGTIKDDGTASDGDDSDSVSDNDSPTLTLGDAIMEEGSTLVFAGSLSNATAYNEEITLSTSLGSAESGDFNQDKTTWSVTYVDENSVTQTLSVDTNGKFTLPAGITSFNVKIPTISDNVYEGSEDFTLSANATSSYITDTDTATGTITDDGTASNGSATDGDDSDSSVDDDRTKFSIDDKTVYEGNTITFTVTRVGDAEANQTVNYAATIESGDTAEVGDFTANTSALSGTLTFTPGETTKTIALNAPTDADTDEDTFTVTLSGNSAGSTIIDAVGIGTIKESNTPPEGTDKTIALGKNTSDVLDASDFGYSDSDGDTFAKVKITNITNIDTDASLLYFNGTSWVGVTLNQEITKSDIDNGYLVFKPGTDEVGINYSSFDFLVSDGTSYDDDANTITYNIQNVLTVSDPLPVDETNSAIFVIRLDEARSGNTVLDLATGGTTISGTDYDTQLQYKDSSGNWVDVTSNQVTIVAGDTFIEVKVKTLEDNVLDNGESLTLTATINGGTNTDMANLTDTGSTTVNDYASLRIDTKPYVLEGDYAVFEIGLSEIKSTNTTVTLGGSGTATMGTDYSQTYEYSTDGGTTWQSISNFTVVIPGSSTEIPSVLVRTQTSNDGVKEPDETITLIANTTDSNIVTQTVSATTIVVDQVNLTVLEEKDNSGDTSVNTTLETGYVYSVLGQGSNGSVTANGDGTLKYTPDTNFSGTDSFTYVKTNTTTGLSVTAIAQVVVTAVADTPDITISIANKTAGTGANQIINGTLDSALSTDNGSDGNWYGKQSPGNSGKSVLASRDETLVQVTDSGTDKSISLSGEWMVQNVNIPVSSDGDNFEVTFTITGSGTDGKISWIGNIADGLTETVISQNLSAGTYTVTIPSSATIGSATTLNALVFSGTNINIDDVSLNNTSASVFTYDVDITNALNDTDTASLQNEELQSVTLVVKDNAGTTTLDSSGYFNQGTYNSTTKTWTFTQAQLDGLKVTVPQTLATSGFKLEATTTAMELSNSDTATNTATISIVDSDDRPVIGDINLNVANQTSLTTTLTDVISTYYSTDGGNTFSWESSLSNIPNIFVDGKLMEFTYVGNQAFGKVGGTTYLTITANMDGTSGSTTTVTDFTVEQSTELFGLQTVTDGDIVLPGGGNLDSVVLAFETSQSDTSVAVDCLVVAHNTIEDTAAQIADSTAEHTVNTNNYYIGVDSNNMNAGDQLIMNFAAVGDSYSHASQPASTSRHEISSIVIDLFNYDTDLSRANPDLLSYTITKVDNTTETYSVLNSDLTPSYNGVTGSFFTITASDGQAFTKIEFNAGSTSSFKLGIASIGSISYDKDFDLQLGYSITDTDGDSDNGIATISFDGNSSISDGSSDSFISYKVGTTHDGGTGTDTLILDSGIDIDFSSYSTITNMEKIDLLQEGNHALTNIALQDIIDITDSNNLMTILGDSADSVSLDTENGNSWSKSGTTDSNGFDTYVNSGNTSVSLKIDADVQVSII